MRDWSFDRAKSKGPVLWWPGGAPGSPLPTRECPRQSRCGCALDHRNASAVSVSRNRDGSTKNASVRRPRNYRPRDGGVVFIATRSGRPIQSTTKNHVGADAFVRPGLRGLMVVWGRASREPALSGRGPSAHQRA